jgi:hypothetical protein
MLLHRSVAILMTLSPIAVSESVPESSPTAVFEQCSRDETTALSRLRTEWAQFDRTDQKLCMGTIGFLFLLERTV